MISIRVGSETYSLQDSVNGASLGDLYALKMQTRRDGSPGVSVKTISETFTRVGELAAGDAFSPLDLLDDDVFIQNMIGVVFLARRKAGEPVTVADASDVSFNDIEFIDEDDEDEAPLGEAAESAV
jgi:hypothetical protein